MDNNLLGHSVYNVTNSAFEDQNGHVTFDITNDQRLGFVVKAYLDDYRFKYASDRYQNGFILECFDRENDALYYLAKMVQCPEKFYAIWEVIAEINLNG